MKSKFQTSLLVKNLTELTGSLEPAISVGFVSSDSRELFYSLMREVNRGNTYLKQRDNAINESVALLFGVEELFRYNPEALKVFKDHVYKEYMNHNSEPPSYLINPENDWYH